MALTLDGTNGIVSSGSITTQSATGIVFSDSSSLPAASSPYVLKNRIINGAMVIDQRNAGASISTSTIGSNYTLDRWFYYVSTGSKFTVQQNAGSVTPPVGFSNYLGVTSSSAYTPTGGDNFFIAQNIEANNISDLAWGTANAKTVTISFWVRSSLTGNFGLVVENAPTYNYSYPILYTINAANTWEYKTITIPAPTAGTWATSGNGIGMALIFSVGIGTTYAGPSGAWAAANYNGVTGQTNVVATNGATFYITGVQLEIGTSATPFERRLYNQELANCQRYCLRLNSGNFYTPYGFVTNTSSTGGLMVVTFPTTMRATPTLTTTGPNRIISGSVNNSVSSISLGDGGPTAVYCDYVSTGLTIGQSGFIGANGSTSANLLFAAEL